MTLWQRAAKVILTFLIFAVLALQVRDCRPYTLFYTVKHADKSHVTKTANFKIQDGGQPPF